MTVYLVSLPKYLSMPQSCFTPNVLLTLLSTFRYLNLHGFRLLVPVHMYRYLHVCTYQDQVQHEENIDMTYCYDYGR